MSIEKKLVYFKMNGKINHGIETTQLVKAFPHSQNALSIADSEGEVL